MKTNTITTTFTRIEPTYTYIRQISSGELFKGVTGKNLNLDDYEDVTDEEAEAILAEIEKARKEEENQ